jgi:MFS family permease
MTGLSARFWRLYASSATSNLADGIGRTALPLIAASFTRNPVLISGLVSFAFLPWLLFALPSGALVDRIDRRYAMATANAVRAASVGVLALVVLVGTANIAIVYVVAFALGMAETMYDSATRALLPQVVAKPDLDRANGFLTVEETLGQTFLGAPVGSWLFTVAISVPLIVNAGGFAVAALIVLTLRGTFRPARVGEPTTIRRDIGIGVRWLAQHRFLRGLTALSATTSLIQSMCNGVFVLYVLEELRLPPGDFGYVLIGAGVGAIVGGVSTPPLARLLGRGVMLTGGAAVSGLATAAMGFVRNGYLGALCFAFVAGGVMTWNVLTMSLRQSLIPEHLFGRVQGAYRTLVWGAIPIGAVAGGVLADLIGIRPVFVLAGVGLLACTVWLARLVITHADELRDQPVGPPPVASTVA